MCLPFCMSGAVNDDNDYRPAPANKPLPAPAGRTTTQLPAQRNGGGRYNVNGYPAQHPPAGAEADRKASNDARRGHAPTRAVPAGVQEKADGTLKQQQPAAARNGMVAAADGARGVAAHNYYYYYEPAHREDAAAAADFYHHRHHPAATATADHESPSIC